MADDDENETTDEKDDEETSGDDESSSEDGETATEEKSSEAEAEAEAEADAEPAPEKPKKKAKKKKTKKAKAKPEKTARASDDDDPDADEEERPRPSKRAAGPAPKAGEGESEDSSTMLALGAFVVAILAVAGLWWWNNQSGEDEEGADESTEVSPDVEPARPDPAADRLPPGHPPTGAEPPPEMPGAIPAPPDVAAPPEDAQRTESGLASKVLEAGTGTDHPAATDRVTVHYTGWTTDGRMFDSSRRTGRPATFALNQVIAGWTEGVQLMVVGEQRRFWIPEDLAYRGRPGAPPGMLVFDVELISFDTPPPPPPTPPDVAAVPRNATTTESGLAFRVLEAGTGTEHPTATSAVRVHYTGWTTDGQMFDSSVTRGEPATLLLNRVIPGWTEGVQLMVVGEKRRFWIPESLAYRGRPGAPPGMLVFDIELVEILQAPAMALPPGHPR